MKEFAYIAGLVMIIVLIMFYRGSTPNQDNFEVQIYDVPESQQRDLVELLNKNFTKLTAEDEGNVARAEVLPSGQVLLFGPKSIQKGFQEIVNNLKEGKSEPFIPKNYRIRVWLVASNSEGSEQPFALELSDVLEELKKNNPGKVFHTLERVQLILGDNSTGENNGELFNIDCSLFSKNTIQICHINLSGGPKIYTKIILDTNRAIVLGSTRISYHQTRLHKSMKQLPDDTELFYILKISEL